MDAWKNAFIQTQIENLHRQGPVKIKKLENFVIYKSEGGFSQNIQKKTIVWTNKLIFAKWEENHGFCKSPVLKLFYIHTRSTLVARQTKSDSLTWESSPKKVKKQHRCQDIAHE